MHARYVCCRVPFHMRFISLMAMSSLHETTFFAFLAQLGGALVRVLNLGGLIHYYATGFVENEKNTVCLSASKGLYYFGCPSF